MPVVRKLGVAEEDRTGALAADRSLVVAEVVRKRGVVAVPFLRHHHHHLRTDLPADPQDQRARQVRRGRHLHRPCPCRRTANRVWPGSTPRGRGELQMSAKREREKWRVVLTIDNQPGSHSEKIQLHWGADQFWIGVNLRTNQLVSRVYITSNRIESNLFFNYSRRNRNRAPTLIISREMEACCCDKCPRAWPTEMMMMMVVDA